MKLVCDCGNEGEIVTLKVNFGDDGEIYLNKIRNFHEDYVDDHYKIICPKCGKEILL